MKILTFRQTFDIFKYNEKLYFNELNLNNMCNYNIECLIVPLICHICNKNRCFFDYSFDKCSLIIKN